MSTTAQIAVDLAGLLTACIWPSVLLLGLLYYRDPLVGFVEKLAGRVTGVSLAGFSLEIARVQEMTPRWTGPGVVDLRKAGQAQDVNDSTLATFMEQLRDATPMDYAVVDLGDGEQWLSTRLYILSIVLGRMRGLRAFVFVETAGDVRRRYIGVASSQDVRWALAQRYEWLERDYAQAYSQVNFSVVSS